MRRAGLTRALRLAREDSWKPGWGRGSRVPSAPTPLFIPHHNIVQNDGLVQI